MKLKLYFILFCFVYSSSSSAQSVEFKHLNEFENLSINKMLLNDDGNLVIAGSKWDGTTNFYFGIYDTSNFQIVADTMHARWDCMNPQNIFYDLIAHPDSGYLVCGRISQCGSNQPIIYWFNNQAQLLGEFNGSYWGDINDGSDPIFEDILVRSDNHILATYRYTSMAPNTDSVTATVLMEFDEGLNLISSDTLGRSHSMRMQYEEDIEKIIFYGIKYSGNSPMNSHPYYCIRDAYSFQKEKELMLQNVMGSAVKTVINNDTWFLSYQTSSIFSTIKIKKYDLLSEVFTDSITITKDSTSNYLIEEALDVVNGHLIVFGANQEFLGGIGLGIQNRIWIFDPDFNLVSNNVLHDEDDYPLNASLKTEDVYYLVYQKYYITSPEVNVLQSGRLKNLISSALDSEKEVHWNVFPNPSSDNVYINRPSLCVNNSVQYYLYDMKGSLLRKNHLVSDKIDLNNFPKGIYFLKISDGKKILLTSKISKL